MWTDCTYGVVRRFADRVLVDIDDTIIEVHGYAKQGSGYGYSGVRGLNALLATVTTQQAAPVVVAQRSGGVGVGRRAAPNVWSPTRWRPWRNCAPTHPRFVGERRHRSDSAVSECACQRSFRT